MLEIYSLNGCPYCKKALSIMKKMDFDYNVIHVSHDEKEIYKKLNKQDTFPQIFMIVGKYKKTPRRVKLGGLDDFEKMIDFSTEIKKHDVNVNKLADFYKLTCDKLGL